MDVQFEGMAARKRSETSRSRADRKNKEQKIVASYYHLRPKIWHLERETLLPPSNSPSS